MYDIVGYGAMIADAGRMSAYARALETRIAPGSVVMDVGTGVGIFALLACRAGAAKVYAVESEDVIQVAREAAAANGFAHRIQFVEAMTSDIDLPERVDGIVSDIRGALPMYRKSVASMIDARERFLKPDGWMIAERDTLWAALVSSTALYNRCTDGWNSHAFDFSGARARAVNSWRTLPVSAEDLLVEPQRWAVLDYKILQGPNVCGEVDWTIDRGAVAHGVSCWFDTETTPGAGFSNSPIAGEKHVYGRAVFPWPEATELLPGDHVRVRFRADLVQEEYTWAWDTRVTDGPSGRVKTTYRQSTFFGTPFSPARLHKHAHTFVPQPNDDARIDRQILELMNGGLTVGEIADRIARAFPIRFKDKNSALTIVGNLSDQYSKDF